MSAVAGAFALAACALVAAVWSLSANRSMDMWRRLALDRMPTPAEHIHLCDRVTDLEGRAPDDPPAVELERGAALQLLASARTAALGDCGDGEEADPEGGTS